MSIHDPNPAQDRTCNLLMIGSSFCYYYVEELYGMLEAAGIHAKVYNAYYNGCSLEKHWTWWKSGEANYQLFVTDENGRRNAFGDRRVSLEECLSQEKWDVISLQEATAGIFRDGAAAHLQNTKVYWQELLEYLNDRFPTSRLLWHQPWTYQIVYGKAGDPVTPAIQESREIEIENYAAAVCAFFNGRLERVPSGRAWQVCRSDYGYDYLTCRLAINDGEGDGFHDGDIGGGQYLNACVWFEIITGTSCIGNSYVPNYPCEFRLSDELQSRLRIDICGTEITLRQDLIRTLQNAAHDAVEMQKAAVGC